jgi:hypothetical protein
VRDPHIPAPSRSNGSISHAPCPGTIQLYCCSHTSLDLTFAARPLTSSASLMDYTAYGLNPHAVHIQLHVPLRATGFGLFHLPPELRDVSFISSCASAEAGLQCAHPFLRPFASPQSVAAAAWSFLRERCANVCPLR